MTNIVSRHGREFEFEDGTPEDVQNKRIENWMRKNAAAELESSSAPAAESSAEDKPQAGPKKKKYNETLANVAGFLAQGLPGIGQLANTEYGRERLGDVNFYRTLAQGALPFADEAIAGVRSVLPGQPDYSTALAEERQGLKDYGETHGEFDKIVTELGGTVLGTAATMGAAPLMKGVQGAGKIGSWIASNPWKASALTGAGAGAVTGFGAGEGGLGPRLESARDNAAVGAALGTTLHAGVKGAEKLLGWANQDNRVADFLRRRLSSEREDLATSQTLPRTAKGDLDVNTPEFTQEAVKDIRGELKDQRNRLYTNPMLADLMPGTTEQVLLKRGPQTEQLARTMLKRQYDEAAPEVVAAGKSQRGRVEDAFDLAFGADTFKKTDEQLLETMRKNANQLFEPAYSKNIRNAEIDDALDRIRTLDPNIWKNAKKWADAERRSIGAIDVTGDLRSYNTQFLHDMKRSMDQALGAEKMANPKFNDVPYLKAKTDLNNAMKAENPAYATAMSQYGDDASLLTALKRGREEAFPTGSVDVMGGMKGDDIKAFLNDPSITSSEKDLFRLGAARALRERTLASNAKKYTHNWADFASNPETESRMNALLTDKMGSWDLLRAQLKKESQNYKGFSRAVGNSRTSARDEMQRELEGFDAGRLAAGVTNPGAFGAIKSGVDAIMKKIDPGTRMANRVAGILGKTGAKGNRDALREVEQLLRAQDARRSFYDRLGNVAPAAGAYSWPYREETL